MQDDKLYKEKAMFRFRRYLFHELRNQLANGQAPNINDAATVALWKTRAEMMELFAQDPDLTNDIDREEAWADVLLDISWFRQTLFDLPVKAKVEIDVSKLQPKTPIAPLDGGSASFRVTEALVEGMEHKAKQDEEKHDAS